MGNRFTDSDGNAWEIVQDDGRYVTLRCTRTHETQEVSLAELRECFEEDHGYGATDEAW